MKPEQLPRKNSDKRRLWDPVEMEKFLTVVRELGPTSNIAIAKFIDMRTAIQVGVYKRLGLARTVALQLSRKLRHLRYHQPLL